MCASALLVSDVLPVGGHDVLPLVDQSRTSGCWPVTHFRLLVSDSLPVYSPVVQIEELKAPTDAAPGKYRVTAKIKQDGGVSDVVVFEYDTVSYC